MYVLCHLLAGLLAGIFLSWWGKDRRLAIACVCGSVLPDVIDKPLGLLLAGSMGFGRIFSHTLLFVTLVLCAGVVVWMDSRNRAYGDGILIAAALGIFLHHVLDTLWDEPRTWFWPLYGPFPPPKSTPLIPYILGDISQPAEWLFGIAFLFLWAGLFRRVEVGRRFSPALFAVLALAAFFAFFCAVGGSPCAVTGWDNRLDNIYVGLVLLGGAIAILWQKRGTLPGEGERP
ncbi:MAG: metal-dependent hydrolase [Methanolinea sp.]|nr:metal-dependent hydrolase [Methanolinea sp.]